MTAITEALERLADLSRLSRLSRMARSWQLQTAKNRLSEVIDEAERGTPQIITRWGRSAVVVLSVETYEALVHEKGRLIDVLKRAPKIPGGLRVRRPKDTGRRVNI
jgi:prevent-host-death family protein